MRGRADLKVWGKAEWRGGLEGGRTRDDKSPDMSRKELPLLPLVKNCTVGMTECCSIQQGLQKSLALILSDSELYNNANKMMLCGDPSVFFVVRYRDTAQQHC